MQVQNASTTMRWWCVADGKNTIVEKRVPPCVAARSHAALHLQEPRSTGGAIV